MRRKTTLLFVLCICMYTLFSTTAISQENITKEFAWDIVKINHLKKNIDSINVFVSKGIIEKSTRISTFDNFTISPDYDAYLIFIDEYPLANWGHPCKFIYVNSKTGEVEIQEKHLPPDNSMIEQLIKFEFSPSERFFKNKKEPTETKSTWTSDNDYAVIISGGFNNASNYERYWNDCSAIYTALIDNFNFDEDHIYTLISDGANPANDRHLLAGGYDSSPLDLDGDSDNDVTGAATLANIEDVFDDLETILDSLDNLFIFVTDHGGTTTPASQDAVMYLWEQSIRDDQLADEIDRVSPGHIMIMMEQCFSGGFIDDLEGTGRVIATAADWDEASYSMSSGTYNEFAYYWTCAVAGETPTGSPIDADTNNDGFVSMEEAFAYAENHDTQNETPQYSSTPSSLGEELALEGQIIFLSGDELICSSSSKTYTLTNCPTTSTVEWTKSSNLNWIGTPSGTSCTAIAVSSAAGSGWIRASITNSDNSEIILSFDVWVGKPTAPTTNPSGTNPYSEIEVGTYKHVYLVSTPGANLSGSWSAGQNLSTTGSTYGYSHSFEGISEGMGAFYVTTSNACGTSIARQGGILVVDDGGGDPPPPISPMVQQQSIDPVNEIKIKIYPNPTSRKAAIELTEPGSSGEIGNELPEINSSYEIRIFDSQMKLRKQISTKVGLVEIDLNDLAPGLYLVQIQRDRKISTKSIIITR